LIDDGVGPDGGVFDWWREKMDVKDGTLRKGRDEDLIVETGLGGCNKSRTGSMKSVLR